ncbi:MULTISPECIES: hypothetical protein [unclassified Streptomyces]|uniref:hypothetical protein n=1 Tax=unclassified Streptomyces TaxID=2593676 RepID=UPI00225AA775|nr:MULTISPECIES: hypothetical protein [unclassified Streptomyces]MCX4526433.1 hypothetical protein [Streptomyces sp. NBC_01551]MCX4543004.1 hypothetical protein [Streptomyces sp. NBC_01565]
MRIRRGAGLALIGVAVMCVAAATVGRLYERPGGLAVVAELNSPWLLGPLAGLALAAGILLRTWRPAAAQPVVTAVVAVALLAALTIPLLLMASDPFPAREYDITAPAGGGGAPRRLVVELTSPLADPVWQVYVDQGTFPTAHRWPLTRFAASDWSKGILQAQWLSHDTIRLIDLDHRPHDIPLTPNGRPGAALNW